MDPWQKETLNLQVGDFIIWRDVELEGQPVSQGMKGQVLSLNDGFRLDVLQGGSVLPKAIVEFECTSSARMGHFGFQVKRQLEPVLIGLV